MYVKITPRKPRDKDHFETVTVIDQKVYPIYTNYRCVASMGIRDHNRVRQAIAALKRALACNVQLYEFVVVERNDQWQLCIQPNEVWPGKADYYAGILRVMGRRWKASPKPKAKRSSERSSEASYLLSYERISE